MGRKVLEEENDEKLISFQGLSLENEPH